MAVIGTMENKLGLQVRKRYGYTKAQRDYIKEHGEVDPDYEVPERGGIYQMRRRPKGAIIVKMKYYAPQNPRTPEQQAWRAVFAAGWVAYGLLTEEEKATYAERAKRLRLSGPFLFLREYLLAHRS